MESTRQQKFSRTVQKELGELFRKNSRELFHGALITVTVVRISPDMSVAKIYLSIFSPGHKSEDILELVKANTKTIRHEFAQIVRHQFRIIPELVFLLDDSIDYSEKIDNLLK